MKMGAVQRPGSHRSVGDRRRAAGPRWGLGRTRRWARSYGSDGPTVTKRAVGPAWWRETPRSARGVHPPIFLSSYSTYPLDAPASPLSIGSQCSSCHHFVVQRPCAPFAHSARVSLELQTKQTWCPTFADHNFKPRVPTPVRRGPIVSAHPDLVDRQYKKGVEREKKEVRKRKNGVKTAEKRGKNGF